MDEIKALIENWKIAQSAGAILPCPRCGLLKMKLSGNAISRRADIKICDSCGTEESIEDLSSSKTSPALEIGSDEYKESYLKEWWIVNDMIGRQHYKPTSEGNYEILCKRKVVLTGDDIDDIMSAALDGGINYWCSSAKIIGEYLGEYASEQISRGGSIMLFDSEAGISYILTLEKFLNGFAAACSKGFENNWFNGEKVEVGHMDAIDAARVIQFGLFGELIYG